MTREEVYESLARYVDDLMTEGRRLEAEYLEVMIKQLKEMDHE